jgi:CBS domain-containing protein
MVAVGLATFVVGHRSIYRSQLATRADSPAQRFRFALPLLASVPVSGAARQARAVVRVDEQVGTARARMAAAGVPGAPVVHRDGTVAGVVDLVAVGAIPEEETIGDHLVTDMPLLLGEDGLDDALGALADHHRDWAPVVSAGRLVGVLSIRDVMAAYRDALGGNVRQARGLRAGGVIIEADIQPGSMLAGHRVSEVAWPRDAVLVAIERGGSVVVPRGDRALQVGDHVSIFAVAQAAPAVEALLSGTAPGPGGAPMVAIVEVGTSELPSS